LVGKKKITMDILEERTNSIVLDDDEDMETMVPLKDRRLSTKKSSRRRRRSSARFLRLGEPVPEEDPDDDNLGEVYQKAIRMNAENRINASNSWNLSLIDHLDRFLAPQPTSMEESLPATGINFTKASCTLDASVKIYSYRVDDVHLTSYKVLANLNRTETGKQRGDESSAEATSSSEASASKVRSEKRKATATDTLEPNLGTWIF
jgi:condensin complex subunit 2